MNSVNEVFTEEAVIRGPKNTCEPSSGHSGNSGEACWRRNSSGCSVGVLVTGTFAPKNFRSRERKYHGMELSLPRAKVPRTFAPWNFRSLELSLPG